jgi:hypothetical protein
LLVATSRGLKVSADDGCSWQVLAFGDRLVPALAAHPAEPDRIYVSTFLLGASSSETSGHSGIQRSEDGGATWQPLRIVPDNDYIHSLLIAPSDANRLYAAGAVYQDGRAFYVLRSNDAGQSWERFDVEIEDAEYDLLLLGVSPIDPDLVLAKVAAGEPEMMKERLLVSRDGGESWQSVTEIFKLRAAAFSADSATLWLAGKEGLFRSRTDFSSFDRVGAAEEMTSVVEHDGALLAGGWHAGLDQDARRNGVGRSTDSGESFEPWMTFQDVLEPIACDPHTTSTPVQCARLWSDWQYEVMQMFSPGSLVGTPPAPDASTEGSDAGARDEREGSPEVVARELGSRSDCGVARGRGGRGAAVEALLGLLWVVKRRRRMRGAS